MKKFLILFLLLPLASCKERPFAVVNVYHTGGAGGMYWSRPEPAFDNRPAGGYAVLKNFLASQPGKKLILDSGDWFSQTPEGTIFKAPFPLKTMRDLGYAATGISYEDVNPGWGPLYDAIINSGMTALSSNIKTKAGVTPSRVKDYIIEEISGVKIGVFSVVVRESVDAAQSRLGDIEIRDELEAAARAAAVLKSKGADIVILLVDVGDNDADIDERGILDAAPGIDIVLSIADQGEQSAMQKYNNSYIVRTAPFLSEVSKLQITFGGDKKISRVRFDAMPLLRDTYGEDEDLKDAAAKLRQNANKKLGYVVAKTQTDIQDIDDGPSYLGELVAGCLKDWAKTEIGIINSDSIRADVPAGKITEYFLYELYPYADTVMSVRVRGEELKNILERSLLSPHNFPQVAGMKIEYDPAAPDGQKIKKILINGAPPSPQTVYRLATTDHVIAGGFGNDEFINAVEFKNTNVDVHSVLRQCFYRKKILQDNPPASWKQAQ